MPVNTPEQLSNAGASCLAVFFKDLIFRQSYAEHIQCYGAFTCVFIHLAKNRKHLYSCTYCGDVTNSSSFVVVDCTVVMWLLIIEGEA